MDNALLVFDDDDTGHELLDEAGTLAAGVDAKLTILTLMTAEEYDEVRETLDTVATEEHTSYDDNVVLDAAAREARDAAEDVLDEVDVDWQVAAARVGDNETAADRILATADDTDADHVFVPGRQRSPTGKAVFGDRAQSVILNFDGPVTTLLY